MLVHQDNTEVTVLAPACVNTTAKGKRGRVNRVPRYRCLASALVPVLAFAHTAPVKAASSLGAVAGGSTLYRALGSTCHGINRLSPLATVL